MKTNDLLDPITRPDIENDLGYHLVKYEGAFGVLHQRRDDDYGIIVEKGSRVKCINFIKGCIAEVEASGLTPEEFDEMMNAKVDAEMRRLTFDEQLTKVIQTGIPTNKRRFN
jgi:hypothetical protein